MMCPMIEYQSVSHKDAPPETKTQAAVREFYLQRLGHGAVGWGRDKDGRFLSKFAQDAEAAWAEAQRQLTSEEIAL